MPSDQLPPGPRGLLNWWQGLILAASSALIGVVAALFITKPGGVGTLPGPGWATQLMRFIPHFLMLFGILADAFTYEGVYWTGTAVGLVSAVTAPYISTAVGNLIGAIQAKMKGGADDNAYPGLKMLSMEVDESGTPETLIVTASILSYYIFDLVTNLSMVEAAGAIVASMVLFGGQAFSIKDGTNKAMYSGLLGVLLGGICFGLITSMAPTYLPSSVIPGSKTAGAKTSGPGRVGMGGLGVPANPNTPTAGGPASAPATCS